MRDGVLNKPSDEICAVSVICDNCSDSKEVVFIHLIENGIYGFSI